MDWITENISIGNYLDAEDEGLRQSTGIMSMICLNDRLRGISAESLNLSALANYNLKDGPGNNPNIFRKAVESVSQFVKLHPKVMVQCHAGRSRSVVVVAGYLMRAEGWDVSQALSFVSSKREAALTPGIEELLQSPFLRVKQKA